MAFVVSIQKQHSQAAICNMQLHSLHVNQPFFLSFYQHNNRWMTEGPIHGAWLELNMELSHTKEQWQGSPEGHPLCIIDDIIQIELKGTI